MNSRQLQCAITLSEIRSFSQAAEKLHLSQPALSKHILNLENELNIKLFDRNTQPLSLTPAGEHFIHSAQDLLYREDQLLKSMEKFRSGDFGRLTIGISPFRSLYIMPELVKKINTRYPNIQVSLQEKSSDLLRKEITEGRYDFAIINLPVDESVLSISPLEPDKLVLAVPNPMLNSLPPSAVATHRLYISDCENLPFIVASPSQEMRRLFNKLCTKANITPRIVAEVINLTTAWAMTHAGIGATLLPLQFINSRSFFDRGVTLFTVEDNEYDRQPVIVTRRGQYISPYAKYAIELLSNN